MSFIGDIQLNIEGNSVILGGDISLTDSDLEFVIRSLRYGPNSFKLNPDVGFGMDKYIGEKNDSLLHQTIITELKDYFDVYGIVVDIDVLPIDNNVISVEIILLLEDMRIVFLFNIESGLLTFEDIGVDEEKILGKIPDNKYLNRL